jgi:hypothetical protein
MIWRHQRPIDDDDLVADLDDPANADVFVEAVRYQRAGK